MSDRIVYLMRGLPSCGKSFTAQKLAGTTGIICETDQYFYSEVGDDPTRFDYQDALLETARQWNFQRFQQAVREKLSPIIVDRGNSRSIESQIYIRYAYEHGYAVELKEPESAWWHEIRVLLKYRKYTRPVLYKWADQLAEMSADSHRVPASLIRRWMDNWKWDLTIEDILHYQAAPPED